MSSEGSALQLVVSVGGRVAVHALPLRGSVTIGRLETNDVPIDDASVSRRHATLHVDTGLTIEDHGSANGTRVIESAAPQASTAVLTSPLRPDVRTPVRLGQIVHVGSVTIVVRAAPSTDDAGIVVRDDAMQAIHSLVDRVAQGPINVLLLGETGVGKEIVAEAVHRRSPRAKGPFLRLNCAALNEQLLESELFGHERGSFTGATAAKQGLLETADGGTVFMDEVGELPLALQAKLLRVLEDRQVTRVGALKARPIDVRFVSATNRNLADEVDKGAFRRDLYYRLNGVSIVIPPLRERLGEIEPLARSFAERASAQLGRLTPPAFSPGALDRLRAHPWPGNIRELRNVIDLAVLLCNGPEISVEHLGLSPAARPSTFAPPTVIPPAAPRSSGASDPPAGAAAGGGLRGELDALERERILAALETCDGNQTRAAEMLGMSRRTLIARIEAYGLPRPRKKN